MDITIDVEDYRLNVRTACIIKHNNKILVHKNEDKDHFCLIGGRVELGENSADTIKREVKEEIGKDIEIKKYIATVENFFKYEGLKYHEYMFIYEVEFIDEKDKYIEETLENIEGKENLKYYWLELDKINNYEIKPKIIKDILKQGEYPIHKINID